MDQELKDLVEKSRGKTMSAKEREEQRINFAYGNAGEGDESTIEAVRATAAHMAVTT